jgi:hypothetical protein
MSEEAPGLDPEGLDVGGEKKQRRISRILFIVSGLLIVLGGAVVVIAEMPGKPSRLFARSLPSSHASARSTVPSAPPGQTYVSARSGPAEMGVEYKFSLYTHCGLDQGVDFDGSLWDFERSGDPADKVGAPPTRFSNPYDYGTMKLISKDEAEFRSSKGVSVIYRRHAGPKLVFICM